MAAVLLLTGGPDHAHDFPATSTALAAALRVDGHTIDMVDDPDDAARRLADGGYDTLVVNALRWRMHGERYDPWRAEWAYETLRSTRDCIAGFVRDGGGLVGSHTASICFDDWPEWRDVLGGAWNWDRSSHPPPAPVRATVDAETPHPVTAGLPAAFVLVDEVYGDLDIEPGVQSLATARRHPDDESQPVVWAHHYGTGRVVYDGFGHDVASIDDPVHARLLRQAVTWVSSGESRPPFRWGELSETAGRDH